MESLGLIDLIKCGSSPWTPRTPPASRPGSGRRWRCRTRAPCRGWRRGSSSSTSGRQSRGWTQTWTGSPSRRGDPSSWDRATLLQYRRRDNQSSLEDRGFGDCRKEIIWKVRCKSPTIPRVLTAPMDLRRKLSRIKTIRQKEKICGTRKFKSLLVVMTSHLHHNIILLCLSQWGGPVRGRWPMRGLDVSASYCHLYNLAIRHRQ